MDTPVTSLGRRSGVNWMRLKEHPIERAIALVRTVLPTPGTSSINTCPLQMTAMRLNATDSALPTITFSTLLITRCTAAARSCIDCIPYSPIAWPNNASIISGKELEIILHERITYTCIGNRRTSQYHAKTQYLKCTTFTQKRKNSWHSINNTAVYIVI